MKANYRTKMFKRMNKNFQKWTRKTLKRLIFSVNSLAMNSSATVFQATGKIKIKNANNSLDFAMKFLMDR